MGQLDEDYGFLPTSTVVDWSGIRNEVTQSTVDAYNDYLSGISFLDDPVGQVTDRADFINPYSIIDINQYANNAAGRALYDEHLLKAQNYLAAQQAAYEEWYNSESQQASRQRQSGLNPDIIGVGDSPASSPNQIASSPLQNVQSADEIRLGKLGASAQILGVLVSGLSAATGLASAFSSISVNSSVREGQNLSNIDKLKSLIASDIDDSLASAMQAALENGQEFDLDSWFSDESNFGPVTASYGSYSGFSSALSQARKAVLKHRKNAVGQQAEFAKSEDDFAKIASSPFFSFEQKLHLAQLKPYMQRLQMLEDAKVSLETALADYEKAYTQGLNVQNAIDVANSKNRYDADYYSEADGKLVAAFEQFMREVETSGMTLKKEINDNYLKMYRGNEDNIDGWKAAYLFSSNGGHSWQEAYMINSTDFFLNFMKNSETIQNAIANNADLREKIASFGSLLNLSTHTSDWQNSSLGWRNYRQELITFIENLEKVADSIE